MSEYTVAVFGMMEQTQADFRQTYSGLSTEVQTLAAQLRSSLSRWAGSAQEAYYQQAEQVNTTLWAG